MDEDFIEPVPPCQTVELLGVVQPLAGEVAQREVLVREEEEDKAQDVSFPSSSSRRRVSRPTQERS